MLKLTRSELSWALYDVANSAFYTTVVAGFFPVFFKQYWSHGVDATISTFHLSVASSVASLVVAVMAPFVGSISSYGRWNKVWLGLGSVVGIVSCFLLAFIPQGQATFAVSVFAIASVGASIALVVYDGLLVRVTHAARYHTTSLMGYGLGYLGGGVLFLVQVILTLKPALFGIHDTALAVKISFFTVGLWWLGFMLPLLCQRLPGTTTATSLGASCSAAWRSLWNICLEIRSHKPIVIFLIAYWLYIDGVGTIMRMAVDYGMSLGFHSSDLIIALLIVQFVGFPATLLYIYLARFVGVKTSLFVGILIYILITFGAYFMTSATHFYLLAAGVALAQGGLQALSRSYFALLIPQDKSSEFFGFYNTFGKFAAILGPILMGWMTVLTGSHRTALLSILTLFILGGATLLAVPKPDA